MVPFEQRRDEMAAEVLDLLPERVVRYRLPDFTIVYCNSAWAAFNKLRPADVVGRSLREFLSDDGNAGLELRGQPAQRGHAGAWPTPSLARTSTPPTAGCSGSTGCCPAAR